jgi:hypothetical protein
MLDGCLLGGLEGFDDPVKLADLVVDDIEADPHGAEVAGDCQVRFGRLKVAARVIVYDHVTRAAGLEDGWDCVTAAAGQDFNVHDKLVCVGLTNAEDFVAARLEDFLPELFL